MHNYIIAYIMHILLAEMWLILIIIMMIRIMIIVIIVMMIVIIIVITTTIIITYILHIMHTYYRGFVCYPASCTFVIWRGTCMHACNMYACMGHVTCGILALFDDVLGLF
jgi:hypothetical protein